MTRVLILGCRGFIGRNLVEALLRDEEIRVTGFGRTLFNSPHPRFRFMQGRFEDKEVVAQALQNQEIVYHLVSETIPSSSWENPILDVEKNLIPTINLLESAAIAGVKKICFASSGGTVYGEKYLSVSEDTVTEPFSPYGIVKRSIESFLEYARRRHGVAYDIFRISNAYGVGQDTSCGLGFINKTLENIVGGQPVVIYGDGEVVRDFIQVKDVARLLAQGVYNDTECSAVFNVAANRPISLNDLLQVIRKAIKVEFEVHYKSARKNDNTIVALDNSKIMGLVKGRPLISLDEGIKELYEFLRAQAPYVEKIIR